MNRSYLPEAVNCFNVYRGGNRLIGVSGEVTLPDLSAITETVEGAGLLGKYSTPIIGMYDSIQQEIPFRILHDDTFSLSNPAEVQDLTLRASIQSTVKGSNVIDSTGMRLVFRGRPVGFKPGTVKMGGQMGASVTLDCFYILIEMDGKTMWELDKMNNVFKVNGKDMLAKIRQQC